MQDKTPQDKKTATFVKKPASPFNQDPHNNRGSKNSKNHNYKDIDKVKHKPIVVKKFKGGSGGDR